MYELGQIYERGMPLFGERTYAMIIPGAPTGGRFGENNMLMYFDEFLCAEIGQVGTQFDGLAHIGTRMEMADGSTQDVFYNGVTADEMATPYGVTKLGIEHVRSFITRGVLIDIAGYKGVEHLDHSYEVTVADIRGALARQGMAESSIQEGDALLFNYGWSKLWKDPETYNTNPPGIGMEASEWIISMKPSMIGSDQWTTERRARSRPQIGLPRFTRNSSPRTASSTWRTWSLKKCWPTRCTSSSLYSRRLASKAARDRRGDRSPSAE